MLSFSSLRPEDWREYAQKLGNHLICLQQQKNFFVRRSALSKYWTCTLNKLL